MADVSRSSQSALTIALALPLSGGGSTAVIARAMKQAGELAVVESDNPNLRLIVKDDRGTPEGAIAAVEEAAKDGAEVMVGPLFSAAVKAAAPGARSAKLPIIAFSNDRQASGPGVYVIGIQPEAEVERIIGYAATSGRRRVAAFVSDDSYGRLMESALSRVAARLQVQVVLAERYQGQANQMLEPLRRIADEIRRSEAEGQPIQALFIPGGADTLAAVSPVLAHAEIDTKKVKLLGSGGWDVPQLGRDAVFVGAWFPAPDPKGWREFAERFAATFGSAPPRIASLAFDGVRLAANQAAAPKGQRFNAEDLTRAVFAGVDGPIRFNANGGVDRGLAVLEVQGFGATVVDPAALPTAETAGSN